jgi:hypothetical protein
MSLSATEQYLLQAMKSVQAEVREEEAWPEGFHKCAEVLIHALKAAGCWNEAASTAICLTGYEEVETKRFYDTLRHLMVRGFAEGAGNLELPAGPRYTECWITPKGLEQLRAARQDQ